MRLFAICYLLFAISTASAASLLTAQKFPSTFADLPFSERMATLAAGYEPYEMEFNAAGQCMSGCAFSGMNIGDVITYYTRQTAMAQLRANELMTAHPEWTRPPQQQPSQPVAPTHQAFVLPQQIQTTSANCRADINPTQTVPRRMPLTGAPRITSNYGPRSIANGSKMHMGIDFGVPDGTLVYSTVAGTVSNVTIAPNGACGNHVKITGPDGFAIRFCHLSEISVKQGDRVGAGCLVAKSGHSGMGPAGRGYAPHLHYEIFDTDNRQIDPAGFIKG